MRLTALTTTKIEGDVIEEFARHTLCFADRLIIVDNGSLDHGRATLGELAAEGLPITVWEGEPLPSGSDGWTTFARRAFDSFETNYLLMLDVDEFIRASSRAALEAALEALAGAHAIVPWVTYVPTPDDDEHESRVLARIRHRLLQERHPYSKMFVHCSFMQQPGTSIVQGNHAILTADAAVKSRVLSGVELAHFPVRSLRQIQSKAVLGWPAFLAMGFNETQTIGYQWRRLNERLLDGADWTANDFYRFAWHYLDEPENEEQPELVLDPLTPVERRYPRESPDLLALAIAYTRQLARAYGKRTLELQHDPRRLTAMIDIAPSDNHQGGTVVSGDVSPSYGEAYFKHYHTGLGPIAYERSAHWLGSFATIADQIVRVFRPDSVLDAGCALGILVESLWDRGVKAQGVDISAYAIDNVRPDIRSHCRVASLADTIEGSFDLVSCIEVLEHLERADAEAAIANICKVTDTVLFSSTPADFAEPTHVNVCPPIVWIGLFAAQGFGPDLLADATFLAPHAMVFRRGNANDSVLLKTYAMIVRYRVLCSERLDALAVERNNAYVATQARIQAESRFTEETQRRAEVVAGLDAARAEIATARDALQNAEAQAVREAQRHADAEASLAANIDEAQAVSEALKAATDELSSREQIIVQTLADSRAEAIAHQAQLSALQRFTGDLQRSNSWRLTRPMRLAAIYLRNKLRRVAG